MPGVRRLKGFKSQKIMTAMLNLHFKYSEDDYIPALRMYLMRKPKFIALFSFFYLLLISLLRLLLGSGSYYETTWFVLFSTVVLFALLGFFLYAFPHQKFRHSYKAVDEYWIHITEHGIIYGTEHGNGALPWRRCTKLLEGKQFYLLEQGRGEVTVIPKRAFKDKEEERAFRAMLKRKLTPGLSSKLLKQTERELEAEYVPPEKAPDWR